jgi:copper chaperone CopZ
MNKTISLAATLLLLSVGVQATTIEMKVHGLVCGFCAQGVEKMLRKNPATGDVFVSLENNLVVVSTAAGKDIADGELTKALTDAGYAVKGITRTKRTMDEVRGEAKRTAE